MSTSLWGLTGPFPVLLGASPYQKALRHLPPTPAVFLFIGYGPIQMYLDEGYPGPHWMAGVTVIGRDGMPDHVARVTTFTTAPFDRAREFTCRGVLPQRLVGPDRHGRVREAVGAAAGGGQAALHQGFARMASRFAPRGVSRADQRDAPVLRHDRAEPITPGHIHELRVELLPMSVLVRPGERLRFEISNWDSAIADVPMTYLYGQKVGTDTYHHSAAHPLRLRLHERPRSEGDET